jgi:flagellin-like hook-associated protein FlgL
VTKIGTLTKDLETLKEQLTSIVRTASETENLLQDSEKEKQSVKNLLAECERHALQLRQELQEKVLLHLKHIGGVLRLSAI